MDCKQLKLGMIGCGLRGHDVLRNVLKYNLGVKVTAICDINQDRVKERLKEIDVDYSDIKFYKDADEMLDENSFDGIIVATRCSLHAQMAIKVMNRGINLYLEKPVATNMEDLRKLKEANEKTKSKVMVSLPLRVTRLVQLAKDIIDSGTVGKIEHVQAYNNVTYGDVYFQSWYRDENEIQGLFIQKAVHDFDYINYILGYKPKLIAAMKSKQIFKGDKPAGLKCADCNENEKCPQSPFIMKYIRNQYIYPDTKCCFAKDTGNEDSSSALVLYDTNMHMVYSQNFFCRNGAGKRGARFFGYKGTLEFDWACNQLKVYDNYIDKVATYQFNGNAEGHGGGDDALALNFIRMMQGKEESCAPLSEAMLSNLMCIKAKESSETFEFKTIEW